MRDRGSIQTDIAEIKRKFEGEKKKIVAYLISGLIVCPFTTGFVIQCLLSLLNPRYTIVIFDSFLIGFRGIGFVFTVVLYVAWVIAAYRLYMTFHHDYETDQDGDYQTYKSGEYGRGHFQTEKERKENLVCSKDPYKLKGDILGTDDKGNLYAINDKIKGMNKNMAVFGASGAGKSAAMVIPMIYQNIIRGHSMIVTDSKGDLYRDTCHLALKHGYVMRVLNLKSGELKNSDGVDLLKMLKDVDDSDAKAEVLANIIIENSGDGHMDYFAINEMNLLKAIILLVIKPDYADRGKDNLAEVYNICAHNTPESLAAMFTMLDDDDPAREAFSIYDQCEPKVKGQILNGMGIRLNKLSNRYLKQIVSNDEIDMLLPMKRKCIYYVVISDMDRAYKFIATLFFSELFVVLSEFADGMNSEERKKRIPVNFILDEYKNTGSIPDMDQKVSTIRSRDITTTIILQDIGQLESMYPDLWGTILNNMSIKVLLKTGDDETAEWFSKKLGTKTIRNVNVGEDRSSMELVEGYDSYKSTSGKGKREVMTAAELMNELSENELIVLIASRHPLKLKKFLDFQHPMHKEAKEKEMLAKKHCPKWRKKIQDKEKAVKEAELREQEERARKEKEEKKRKQREKEKREAEQREIDLAFKDVDEQERRKRQERERIKREQSTQKQGEQIKKNPTSEGKEEPVKEKTVVLKEETTVPNYIQLDEDDIPDVEMEIDEDDIPDIEMEEPEAETSQKEQDEEDNDNSGWVSKWVTDADDDEDADEPKGKNASDQALSDLFG